MAASVVLRLKFLRLVPLKPRILAALHPRKNLTQLYSTRECKCNQYSVVLQRIRNTRIIPFARGFSSSEDSNESRKVVQFKLSDIGEGIREVNVKEWFVKVGDRVAQFDGICEVQSDKASVTITSRYDGIITKLYYDIDDVALVGQPLVDIQLEGKAAIISTDDYVKATSDEELASSSSSSDSDDDESEEEEEDDSGVGSVTDDSESIKVLATPPVRHLASQKKVNLKNVKGTGKHGRILKEDVLNYIKAKDAEAPSLSVSPAVHPEAEAEPHLVPKSIHSLPKFAGVPEDRSEVITGIRKAMVKSMTLANSIPHFCFCDEVNLSELVNLKPVFKEAAEKYGLKFSYTSVFIKVASVALTEFPLLNSTLDSECKTITYKGAHNIGVAMDTPDGLVVPNVKNVAQLSILEVASELNRLIQLGATGKLGPADLMGGTFTLSNVGMIGGTYTKPVIFAPEVVIGALGSIMKLPRFDDNDKVIPAHVMNVSWSADHRIIDGATMARFSNVWKSYLENPLSLLLHLK